MYKTAYFKGVFHLEKNGSIEERAINLAHYIIDSKDTVRGAARKFGVSKSTVHKDVSERLLKINPILAHEVREILDENKAERHIRGGMATKLKYGHSDKEAI
ncbi:MAG: sporulation transcriptional regulator SpoIIID [Clostridia bacterium]|nr:sporulation transcriptional regulator SpoIIID [Clostridia bacterium]